jgi:hypothetical protein
VGFENSRTERKRNTQTKPSKKTTSECSKRQDMFDQTEFEQIITDLDKQEHLTLIPIFEPSVSIKRCDLDEAPTLVLSPLQFHSEDNFQVLCFSDCSTGEQKQKQRKKRYRKRSADICELEFVGLYDKDDSKNGNGKYGRLIRKWKNDRDMTFYDCVCGKRRAVQDLRKLKHHVDVMHSNS